MIDWQHVSGDGPIPDHLEANPSPHVSMGMCIDGDGDYILSFVVAIDGSMRTLPQVEDFARRIAEFLEDEPVIP